jgi:hypothetical protein
MAYFVSLTSTIDNQTILVNLEKVVSIQRITSTETWLVVDSDLQIAVRETREQIERLFDSTMRGPSLPGAAKSADAA